MKIQDILDRKGDKVVTIAQDAPVHEAILRLNEHRIGGLIVTGKGDATVGIVTERDILRICGTQCVHSAPGHEAGKPILVKEIMTRELATGSPDDELLAVMSVMTQRRIRHLPILADGKLKGIISIGDVVNACVKEAEFENRQLKEYIHGVA